MKFNNVIDFEKDVCDLLVNYATKDLRECLECLIQTHNLKPLIEILNLINKNKF